MANNGEINQSFGVYRSHCCALEIIIRKGATFPGCPNHPGLNTNWKPVDSEGQDVPPKAKNVEPAA
jgi:hypothetical protein